MKKEIKRKLIKLKVENNIIESKYPRCFSCDDRTLVVECFKREIYLHAFQFYLSTINVKKCFCEVTFSI